MSHNRRELSEYRIIQAKDYLQDARDLCNNESYKSSINRSYYAPFCAIRSILAIEGVDFRRHKDVIAHFNKTYVKTEIFPRELGGRIADLQNIRDKCDYDDFYIASKEKAQEQIETAESVVYYILTYLANFQT